MQVQVMSGSEPGHRRYEFGGFTLDVDRAVLLRAGQEVHLRPKSFDVLRHLVEHAGTLVDRQTLMDAVWGTTVVTEDSLTQCIIDVRRALGDRHQRMVRTVPRRGFIFEAAVRPAEPETGPSQAVAAAMPVTSQSAPAAPSRRASGRPGVAVVTVLAVALVAAAVGWWLLAGRDRPVAVPPPEAHERSIAVLRFLDLSPGGDQAYFADGLAEEILHLLAQSPELRVTARSSSFAFGATAPDIAAVSSQLGVRYVLEGSVRRDGDALRVTAQLIDAATRTHVWSRTYDRTFGRMLELQQAIASDVAAALQVTLAGDRRSATPVSAEAQEQYLLGRYLFHRRGPGELAAAESHFEQAVRLDPGHARAWTALAGAINVRALDELRDPGYRLEDQRQALERALAIDSTLAEAHVRLARYYVSIGDRAAAEAAFARARELGPQDPLVLATLVSRATRDGRLAEAIQIAQRVVEIDPLSSLYRRNLGHLLLAAGRYPAALEELRREQALSPVRSGTEHDLVVALLLNGQYDDAREQLASVPDGPRQDQLRVLLGPADAAEAAFERLLSDGSVHGLLLLAELAAHRGDADVAFERLGAALRAHDSAQARLEFDLPHEVLVSPFLRKLHDDPRWPTLLAAIPPPWR